MIALPRRVLIVAGIVVLILAGLNWGLRPDVELQFSPTSFGVGPSGYKAAFDLATELALPTMRSYRNPLRQPLTSQLWMVSPSLLEPQSSSGDADARDLLQWVRAGGTAIVFGGDGSAWKRLDLPVHTSPGLEHAAVTESFATAMRRITVPALPHFEGVPKDAIIDLRADDAPFAIERKVGKGRLIAVADDGFLRNVNLGNADNSLLFIDLMRRFDGAVFDEHCHGMLGDISLATAIADSRAILPLSVGLMLAVVWVLAQQTWPRRSPANPELPSPTLAPFVESLGVLYARASDPQAAFRVYREGFLRRLRRQLMPFGEMDEAVMLQRIACDRSLLDETRRWLLGQVAPRNKAELVEAVRALEAYPGVTHG